jgi:hypothetical protein
MKTIICPSNYSPISVNALHYAQAISELAYTEMVYWRKPLLSNLFRNRQVVLSDANSDKRRINADIRSQADYGDPTIQLQAVYSISAFTRANHGNLLILGVEKEFGLYDMYSESIVNLLKQAQCPALFIPEEVEFKSIKRIVVVVDHEIDINHRTDFLVELATLFQAEIIFLQITGEKSQVTDTSSANSSPVEDAFFESMKSLYLSFPYKPVSFHKIHGNILESIAAFIGNVKADLVVNVPQLQVHAPFSYSSFCKQYVAESLTIPLLAIDSQPVESCKALTALERTLPVKETIANTLEQRKYA